jgi:dephospho-CoA kinase
MLILGLTGGIGSGKSTVASTFSKLGITVVDADKKARDVVEPGQPALSEIARYFGSDILLENGSLDRAKLRTIIFNSEENRRWLEQLLHPIIREAIEVELTEATSAYAILESPLLFETDQHEMTCKTLLIDVPTEVQITRTTDRDKNTKEQVEKIIAAQLPREEKIKRADYVIDNSKDLATTQQAIHALHKKLLMLATKNQSS